MPKQVLILDDNHDNRQLLAYCFMGLKAIDYEVHQATCGSDVKALLENTHFNLALLDVELPDADGLTLAEELHRQFPELVLIMLSANDEWDKLNRARQIGVYAYVVKPFSLTEIMTLIREMETSTRKEREMVIL